MTDDEANHTFVVLEEILVANFRTYTDSSNSFANYATQGRYMQYILKFMSFLIISIKLLPVERDKTQ